MAFYDLPPRPSRGWPIHEQPLPAGAAELAFAHGQIGILSPGHKTGFKYSNRIKTGRLMTIPL